VEGGDEGGLGFGPGGQGGGKGQARLAAGKKGRDVAADHPVAVQGDVGQAEIGFVARQDHEIVLGRQVEGLFPVLGLDAGGKERLALGQFQHEGPVEVAAGVGADDVHPGDGAQRRLDIHADHDGAGLAQSGEHLGVQRSPEHEGPFGLGGQGFVVQQHHGHMAWFVAFAGQDMPQIRRPGVHAAGRFQGRDGQARHQGGQGEGDEEKGFEVHGPDRMAGGVRRGSHGPSRDGVRDVVSYRGRGSSEEGASCRLRRQLSGNQVPPRPAGRPVRQKTRTAATMAASRKR